MSEARHRRPTSWAVVELTRAGERKVEDGTIAPLIRDVLSLPAGHPVFVPSKTYVSGGRKVTVHLMEGYVFVGSDGHDLVIPHRTDQPYIKRLLTTHTPNGGRVLSVVPDSVVAKMESDLAEHVGDDVRPGSSVLVNNGLYSMMEGVVMEVAESGDLVVRFQMRSLDIITVVPRKFAVPSDAGVDDV
jgi:hypothetical protein